VDNEHIITDAEIEAAFEGTNFGTAIPRRL
jgi:hypothetical protein